MTAFVILPYPAGKKIAPMWHPINLDIPNYYLYFSYLNRKYGREILVKNPNYEMEQKWVQRGPSCFTLT